MEITRARKEHVPQLVKMWPEFMGYHAAIDPYFRVAPGAKRSYKKHLMTFVEGSEKAAFVAVEGNEVIGLCMVHVAANPLVFRIKKIGVLEQMHVRLKYQRKGAGAALLKAAIAWFKKKNIRRIELSFIPGNKKGRKFWIDNSGFKVYRLTAYKKI